MADNLDTSALHKQPAAALVYHDEVLLFSFETPFPAKSLFLLTPVLLRRPVLDVFIAVVVTYLDEMGEMCIFCPQTHPPPPFSFRLNSK